jgi:hypothetical protein
MTTWQDTERTMNAWDKAFMDSFKRTHAQYEIPDKDIEAFLTGNAHDYFDGYTQLADAHNLWAGALQFARRST